MCGRKIKITRIAIASNSGCHPPPIATKRQPFENNLTVNADQRIAIYLSVNLSTFWALSKVSHFFCFHGNGSHFENSEVKSLIYTCKLTIILSFIKFGAFWKYLTFPQFPWQRWPFWKFQLQKSYSDLSVYNHIKFHQFWSILKFLKFLTFWLVSMVTDTIPNF